MRLFILILALLISFTTVTLAEYSDAIYRAETVMSGNNIRTILYNYGLIGNVAEISFEWPQGTGNEYIGDYIPLVGLEINHPNGQTLQTVLTSLSPRQSPEYGSDGTFWGFEAKPGYASLLESSPGTFLYQIARNTASTSWPESWPNRNNSWDGRWPGLYGPGTSTATLETYFVMDDANDEELRYLPDNNGNFHAFYPVASDTNRAGYGLDLEVYNLQFNDYAVEDALITVYVLHNNGDLNIPEIRFGALYGTLMGGRSDSEDDWTIKHEELPLIISYDYDDNASPGWVPVEEGVKNIGALGSFFLDSPDNIGLTGLNAFSPPGAVRMNDDVSLWNSMTPGQYESNIAPEDGDYIMSCTGSSLEPGDADTFIVVTCLGRDVNDVVNKYHAINFFYENGWEYPESNFVLNAPLADEEIDGDYYITWNNTGMDSVDIYYSYEYGDMANWLPLAFGIEESNFFWETGVINDGGYVRLRFIAYINSLPSTPFTSEAFVINNPVESDPELFIINPNISGVSLSGTEVIEWLAVDADGDNIDISLTTQNWPEFIISDLLGYEGVYSWDTRRHPNSRSDRLIFTINQNGNTFEYSSVPFEINNQSYYSQQVEILHTSGQADADIGVRIFIPEVAQNNSYSLEFSHHPLFHPDSTLYRVSYLNNSEIIVDWHLVEPFNVEGQCFDGMRVSINDYATASNPELTTWTEPDSAYLVYVSVANIPQHYLSGIPIPKDYQMVFYEEVVDTSTEFDWYGLITFPATPVNYKIFDISSGESVDFLYYPDNQPNFHNYRLALYEDIPGTDSTALSWQIQFRERLYSGNIYEPEAGDTLNIRTFKCLTADDVYEIHVPELSVPEPEIPDTPEIVSLYPNPFNSIIRLKVALPHIADTKVEIFNLLGQRVAVLNDGPLQRGMYNFNWDAQNHATGMYFMNLQIGNKIQTRKILLMK